MNKQINQINESGSFHSGLNNPEVEWNANNRRNREIMRRTGRLTCQLKNGNTSN